MKEWLPYARFPAQPMAARRASPVLSPMPGAGAKPHRAYTCASSFPPVSVRPTTTFARPRMQGILRRELQLLALYRLFEAVLMVGTLFSPMLGWLDELRHPWLGRTAAVLYLLAAMALVHMATAHPQRRWQVLLGVSIDIAAATLAIHAAPEVAPGISLMLLFNIGIAALLLPLRLAMAIGVASAAAAVGEVLLAALHDSAASRSLAELTMVAVGYMAMAILMYQLGQRTRETARLAQRREAEAADLAATNALIIRRMRTGVLMVEADGSIRLANEAALSLFGGSEERRLEVLSPELHRRLQHWRRSGQNDESPLLLTDGDIEIAPRFAGLQAGSDTSLVFLDDASLASRRAESLTLATMGRFSASLAHEIRNPLAAISYATQLLEESNDLSDGDRRMLEIIHQQCQRTNTIIESVLGLARRERANPEYIELVAYVRRFLEDFRQITPAESAELRMQGDSGAVAALFDPRHLQQVLTVLVQNAIHHGRMPGSPAKVILRVDREGGLPVIDVIDRGPGIPEAVRAQLFKPFYTTAEHGTGLGLYIARELCLANQGNLDYVPVASSGSCFRISMASAHQNAFM